LVPQFCLDQWWAVVWGAGKKVTLLDGV
jgi:hypothetical protein